ncbi:SDR family oxidoreductase [Streptomyces sp. NPDC057702]|uniref:SDR family oxidoreductase n=1 Tax=unclassified Streptomyces TaxID=2593676 RepID=UPI0036C842E5
MNTQGERPLSDTVALVAGATRGASRAIAVALGEAGATVYVTGRTSRAADPGGAAVRTSEVGRTTETIEETAELVTAAGGTGIAVRVDHLEPDQVRALAHRVDEGHGRLDILVNGLWGGDRLIEFDTRAWEVDLDKGLRMLRLGIDTHLITSHFLLPLLIRRPGALLVEMTDGTADFNKTYRGNLFFDIAKNVPIRAAFGISRELTEYGGTALSMSPGFLRSEEMLDHFGVSEENWRDAVAQEPHFAIAESPALIGRAVAAVAADQDRARWNGASLSSGELARVYGFRDTDGSQPDCFGYFRDIVYGGKEGTAEDYR